MPKSDRTGVSSGRSTEKTVSNRLRGWLPPRVGQGVLEIPEVLRMHPVTGQPTKKTKITAEELLESVPEDQRHLYEVVNMRLCRKRGRSIFRRARGR